MEFNRHNGSGIRAVFPGCQFLLRVTPLKESKNAPGPKTESSSRNGDKKKKRLSDDVRPFHDNP
jgi:hypothetical protein